MQTFTIQRKNCVELSATPAEMMQQYLECINDGDVKRALTEDCILNLFARCVQGGNAAASYLRTQLSGRYQHADFGMASCCAAAQQVLLTNRYARRFDRLWKRKRAEEEQKQKVQGNPQLQLRAASDEDEEVEDLGPKQLVTPPRPGEVSTTLQYIESLGVLRTLQDSVGSDDGGIDFGDCCQVRVVLGFRRASAPQVCLVVYEKLKPHSFRLQTGVQRPRYQRRLHNGHTDDEGEAPARLNVRRTLFGPGGDDADDDTVELEAFSRLNEVEASLIRRSMSRKRHHAKEPQQEQKATKYPTTVLNSMRF
ncbi:hypothetical protein KR044_002196 [Drosophila immigrans]|nr:hypothetical protein KR044_002196 [Drosophila immigrans]